MTKQEEISEGLARLEFREFELHSWREGHTHLTPGGIDKVINYFASKDVVIRVKREKPPCGFISISISHGINKPHCSLAGYVAVEPIKEAKDDR